MTTQSTNRLAHERSPYLQQHADNPIDWYPWCEEAFARAARENKPVFVSIGYSTCHWCHVMAHESFASQEVADALNHGFIAIKVDREERPDVDHVYMEACVQLTGGGGWPLSVFLTPDRLPFFAGTYYPKEDLLGLLQRVEALWRNDKERLLKAGKLLLCQPVKPNTLTYDANALVHNAYKQLCAAFDERNGGFGAAPKFPMSHNLMFLQRYALYARQPHAEVMVLKTLEGMARGGLHDHIGGGFCRYATDARWLVPHFEKMLYDNALLAVCYAENGDESMTRDIVDYCLNVLRGNNGGFFTAQDADSEGIEGKYMCFTPKEIIGVLGVEDGQRFCGLYNITERGNFEGSNIPNLLHAPVPKRDAKFATEARRQLLTARHLRIQPSMDTKQLSGHNGLMLAALATAARLFNDDAYRTAALACAEFIAAHCVKENTLHMGVNVGEVMPMLATSDDVAYVAWGFYRLHQATLERRWLDWACTFADLLLSDYMAENNVLNLPSHAVRDLPTRPQHIHDGALPCGNAMAAGVFQRLAHLTHNQRYQVAYHGIINALAAELQHRPLAHSSLLSAMLPELAGTAQVALTKGDAALTHAATAFHPFTVISSGEGQTPQAVVCQESACGVPITNAEELTRALDGK